MNMKQFPVIDPIATGKNIIRLRAERGMSVRDLQAYFGFEEPQAIYKWQQGKSLPSVDNLYALGALFEVPMEDILVSRTSQLNLIICEQQAVIDNWHILRSSHLGVIQDCVEPHIHDGVQFTEYNSDFLSCNLQKQSADRPREEKESRSFIAVIVIL